MKSLRSFPCEEPKDHDLLYCSETDAVSPPLHQKGILREELDPVLWWWCSLRVTKRSAPNEWISVPNSESLVEVVAQDIILYAFSHFCLSLNTLNVYSEMIWCLSLSPKARLPLQNYSHLGAFNLTEGNHNSGKAVLTECKYYSQLRTIYTSSVKYLLSHHNTETDQMKNGPVRRLSLK